jgi:Tfp pilus assembly protein PilP
MRTLSFTFVALTVVATLAYAQATPSARPAAPAAPAAATTASPAAAEAPADEKSDAAEPSGFTYEADGRRDPFISLLRRGLDSRNSGPKMAGLAGLGTSEVSLRGVLTSEGAFVGILQGVDAKNYIVRVGDRLSDGTIRSISKDSMVILQQVNDPLSLEKQREVRKLLRQTEEAK